MAKKTTHQGNMGARQYRAGTLLARGCCRHVDACDRGEKCYDMAMRRRTFTILSAILLFLCILAWARSYFVMDWFGWSGESGNSFFASRGVFGLAISDWRWSWKFQIVHHAQRPAYPVASAWPGFGLEEQGAARIVTVLHAPFWFLAAIFLYLLLYHALRLRTARQAERIAQGLCVTCGHDLRASKDRCPECGSPVPAGHVPKVAP
jgi:hypothetical protein